MMSPGPLTPEQLAERWQMPVKTVWKLSREGSIPSFKVGKRYRYRLDAIEAFERGEWPPTEMAA
jgi:excisionase family DNA binding protein